MTKFVTLTIDGVQAEVPEGTLVVNAAKKAEIDIPVFCYHPKMEPVGMCRMCLVEIGRPVIDRATGQPVLQEDGSPKIQFGAKLETACTTPVSQGMVVLGMSEKARAGRKDIVEFLLTSHPLDCPVCDKGGECPLQNLTMGFGPGQSRYLFDEKMHMAKHVPLGDLIYLDRERCIQCGRCVRFQSEIADEPVIGFFQRGRSLEIVTFSEPGFDSYWSGNTTDICPVGALTTADFRFRARPWELRAAASLCNQCPVGCNTTLNVRREAVSGGKWVVKRVMPRQNEEVNEIWICDKGRFGYRFADQSGDRLEAPLVRRDGKLIQASWEEALALVAERFGQASSSLFTLVGGRLANEDLFNLRQFTRTLGGETALYTHMAGGELTTQIGLAPESNIAHMGPGTAILVVGCDLEEEAPIWWLRIKQAAQRGARLIVLNPRSTHLDRAATWALRYPFGSAAAAVLTLINTISAKRPELPESVQELGRSAELRQAAQAFAEAQDGVILYGSEGMDLAESAALAQACANLLLATNHIDRPNNGLLGVWPRANDQGAWEMGLRPRQDLPAALQAAKALYIAAADPVGDDPAYQAAFGKDQFVVVQDLFLTPTARLADVVLPAQAWTEREGSYTSGERRVQRFYPAMQPTIVAPPKTPSPSVNHAPLLTASRPSLQGPQTDFSIPAFIAERLELTDKLASASAAAVFLHLAAEIPTFAGLTYQRLAEAKEQWPIVGRGDLYYGGTSYENSQGLGVRLPLAGSGLQLGWPQLADFKLPKLGMMAFPVTRLYDRGTTLLPSELLLTRIGEPYVVISAQDAARLKVQPGDMLRISFTAHQEQGAQENVVIVVAQCSEELPERVVLVPRSFGIPIYGPSPVEVKAVTNQP
jgi:NADH-quinone oxidoreductase subunit G